jgi:hypothetical protein
MVVIRYDIAGINLFLLYRSFSSYYFSIKVELVRRVLCIVPSAFILNSLFREPSLNDSASGAPYQAVDGFCGNYSGVFGVLCFRQMKSKQPQHPLGSSHDG